MKTSLITQIRRIREYEIYFMHGLPIKGIKKVD